jgi:uncharacterized protein YggU (UPF0235/DUF167 family)
LQGALVEKFSLGAPFCYNIEKNMYIHVKVMAGVKEEKIHKKSDTQFLVSVREEAERNMANKRIVKIFQQLYGTGKVRIINGHQSTSKLLSVDIDDC